MLSRKVIPAMLLSLSGLVGINLDYIGPNNNCMLTSYVYCIVKGFHPDIVFM